MDSPVKQLGGGGQSQINLSPSRSPRPMSTIGGGPSSRLYPRPEDLEDPDEKFRRLIRRMEHCAKAREESTKILSQRFAQRDVVKSSLRRENEALHDAIMENRRRSEDRWSLKLQNSPYRTDLQAESERIEEEKKIRELIDSRKKQLLTERAKHAQAAIFQRGLSERDDLEILRNEKRTLVQKEKALKAMRDTERTQARVARVESDRRNRALERQQLMIQQRLRAND